MERVAFVLQVKPEHLEEYRERHHHVWPEMLQALRESGWRNYSLFLRDDGLLVGYVEVEDFNSALEGINGYEVNALWRSEMSPFFEHVNGQKPDELALRLEEVFHLE